MAAFAPVPANRNQKIKSQPVGKNSQKARKPLPDIKKQCYNNGVTKKEVAMRKESAGVTEALLKSAQLEFLTHGFHDASLRRISAGSGVSTNSIYTRFGDKEGLFEAIVKPAADGLMDIYMHSVNEAAEGIDIDEAVDSGNEGTDEVLDYVYEHFTAFKLIFCRSAGTSYEHFFDKLAGIEEEYYKEFAKKYAAPGVHISDFFIHVMCRTGWQYIYEIVSHDLPHEEAVDFMKNIRRYFYAGWQNVLGIEVLKKEPEKKNYKD